jgi:hypothetical protein
MSSLLLNFHNNNLSLRFFQEHIQEKLKYVFLILIIEEKMKFIQVQRLCLAKFYGKKLSYNINVIDTEHGIDTSFQGQIQVIIIQSHQVFYLSNSLIFDNMLWMLNLFSL